MIAQVQTQEADRFSVRLSSAFVDRSIRLARQWHLEGKAHLVEIRQNTVLWRVPSRSGNREYYVVCDKIGSCWCECAASSFNQACSHCGSAILGMRRMAQASAAYVAPESELAAEAALHRASRTLEAHLRKLDHGEHAPLQPVNAGQAVSIFKS